MPEQEGCSQGTVTVAQLGAPISVDTETLAVQGGVAVATLLTLSLLCWNLVRLVRAIKGD